MSKDIFPDCEICENRDMICEYCYKLEEVQRCLINMY